MLLIRIFFQWAAFTAVSVFSGCVVLVPFIEPYEEPPPPPLRSDSGVPFPTQTARTKAGSNKADRYVKRFVAQLNDPRAPKRSAAASHLGMLGPDAAPAIPALIARLDDESKFVRRAVVKALGKIGVRSPEVEDALNRAQRDRDKYVAQSAANAARQLRAAPSASGAGSTSPVYVLKSNKRIESP